MLGDGACKFSNVFDDVGEVFSEVENGVNAYPKHFVGFARGAYWMRDTSKKVTMWIYFCSVAWFLCVRGLPRAQQAPAASHLVFSSWSPVYWLKRWSF